MDRKVVVPGDLLSEDAKRSGEGTFVKDGNVYSLLYGLANYRDKINVIPLAGKYMPAAGDNVIGVVKDITFSNWIVDINSPYDGLLHISEFPRRIESDEMSKYLRIGSSIMARVKDVDPTMKVELTLNDRKLGPIRTGQVVEISHTRVPRLIGKGGSMISMLKKEVKCSIFVGQNGRIWINGSADDTDLALKTIALIEKEAHTNGLTDRIVNFLKAEKKARS
ncbi:MAG TPA: exosome complex RNA-binding protein Rrp4 [Methanothrix sp.]|jgi:exosome complex component RRP4|uniref:exosome complex RNA-binding protein Rrp4 n=1 Tax=Methanothrix sp. TaxID=90426 RepID=UPI002CE68075|nr:exosome complex RNA-binding protein Rrp4 [Methanothrix sp.]MDI9418386.1 exosome complex RNA-binding protein Rrp4 [Euryarchaeota archaeon]HON35057.1 exosome complex RNA-binding protein Rrp4 [Methanothrix sp.]HRU75487.1 exosome complex RNA-binding protein Rrp4 [Methanothrix sp.]